ncbi:hypothetical protein M0220_09395 [Halomonas qinghailakensis]|uniref:Uncharacterized protein n=1 Tax=Halomonas qinghailakensis TaxID=2937790 RepID=A0AA46YMQ0_9GAMM|nr:MULTISPECIES: hypothetical protein [Halomonas]UYO73116.1 hypothetical protein M0220_09395 [Halomonas sp. ZZQ-149]
MQRFSGKKQAQTAVMLSAGLMLLLAFGHSLEARDRDPLIGPYPYDFPERANTQSSLILQEARWRQARERNSNAPAANRQNTVAGLEPVAADSSEDTIIVNSSTSIAVGNWQQIEMTLGDGAEGLIMTENHQTNKAEANSLSKIRNLLNMQENSSDLILLDENIEE